MLWTVFLLSLCVSISTQAACNETFLGSKCQYKCHCTKGCDSSGNCNGTSNECDKEWFGLACQYQNLAYDFMSNVLPSKAHPLFFASVSDECKNNKALSSVTIIWNMSLPFSWMRFKVNNTESLYNLSLSFKGENNNESGCIDRRMFQIDPTTFDVHCNLNMSMKQMKIEGDVLNNVCYIRINAGRNMALLQENVSQSSQYKEFKANYAVDGKVRDNCADKQAGCSHTADNDQSPSWTITFDQSYDIDRFVLYNRYSSLLERMRYFDLQVQNNDGHFIFNYSDTNNTAQQVYTVLYHNGDPVSKVTVRQTHIVPNGYDPVPFVSINEFQAYGECVDGTWGLECNNTCDTLCKYSCNKDDGTCNAVCIGYTNPPSCSNECEPTKYGLNCSNNCSKKCYSSLCDKQTGICTQGCSGYSNFPLCTQPCVENYYGWNCSEKCSASCLNQTCSSIDGKCFMCNAGYQGAWCNQKTVDSNDDSSDNTTLIGALVGGIVGTIIILVILVALIVYRRRRNGKNHSTDYRAPSSNNNYSSNSRGHGLFNKSQDSVFYNNDSKKNASGTVYRNMDEKEVIIIPQKSDSRKKDLETAGPYSNTVPTLLTNTPIPVKELEYFIKNHSTDYFEMQFQSLPQNKDIKSDIGLQDENKNKNRFKNIYPYDHSRVHLNTNIEKNERNYINASYIKGYDDGIEFIASQGPNTTTIYDFVRMLWEQKTEKVIMLTNLIEEGKTKCEKYWPDTEKMVFGEIKLRHISTQTFSDYTIRKLEMFKKGQPTHELTQFHYTAWPDKSVPVASWSLVDFEQRVFETPSKTPIVVHCSAGVGRTGTFIALHNVMKEAEKTGQVNFYNTVSKLRQDRMFMVQTAEQYEFLHKSALTAIVCMGTSAPANNFSDRIKAVEKKTFTGETKISSEFKAVRSVSLMNYDNLKTNETSQRKETTESVYQNDEGPSKDRFPDITTSLLYRPHLTALASSQGHYINALILPSYFQRDQEIITQLPMPTTVTDFWRLVTQLNVSLIVAFEVEDMINDETFGKYISRVQGQVLSCPPFEVSCSHSKKEQLWTEHSLNVSLGKDTENPESLEDHKVVHMECSFTDFDANKMLTFIKAVRQHKSKGRVVYMCRNGALYSGLTYVLCSLLDRIDNDSSITVPLVVGSVKSIRPAAIATLDQYQLVYQVLEKYIQTSREYSNVKPSSNAGKQETFHNEHNDDETKVYVNL